MPRLSIRLCSACQKHEATNYDLVRRFPIPGAVTKKNASVNAGTIDLCNSCWNKYANKRTLTLQRVEERMAQRVANILAREQDNAAE